MSDSTAAYSPDDRSTVPEIPDFEMVRQIGCGAFGQVWLATNRTTGHVRAVKVVALRHGSTADLADREITSLTRLEANVRLRHPHLMTIHHVAKTDEYLYYVMDPADDVSGKPASLEAAYEPATLRRRLQNGPLSADECWRCAEELLEGLALLHGAGMVHRDVKPANCLFVEGELQLADFGLLTEVDPLVSRIGTVKYMPPDGRMDARADVYAAGLVIYEMIAGLPADRFPRLGERTKEVADDPKLTLLVRTALRACQPDPGQRFQTAAEMAAELQTPRPDAAVRHSRRRFLVAAASTVAVLAAGGFAYWATRPPRVHVNFITLPYEATVHLDGRQMMRTDVTPYTTPCTIDGLPARVHHVVFKCEDIPDYDAGSFDFATTRQINVSLHGWDQERNGR